MNNQRVYLSSMPFKILSTKVYITYDDASIIWIVKSNRNIRVWIEIFVSFDG